MVSSNDDGIQKVIDDEGKYAYFMESASIEYIAVSYTHLTLPTILRV